MNKTQKPLNQKGIWIILIIGIGMMIGGAVTWHLQSPDAINIFSAGLGVFAAIWVILLTDMIRHKMHNKFFWVFSMFVLPLLAVPVYLYRREALIRQ